MFVVATILLLVMFIPCWLGIRLGATFATVLGVLTIIPLVLLCVLPLFKPGSLDGFSNLTLSLSSSPAGAKGSWQLILGWSFIFTWSVLAMEAAACYIGECREPVRDAKIAITAEGLFGFFVYVTLPIMVFAVLGTAGFDQLAKDNPGWIGDANILFQGYVDKIFGVNDFWTWLIGLSLIIALSLSVLNAIMGSLARHVPERARRDPAASIRLGEQAQGAVVLDARQPGRLDPRSSPSVHRCRSTCSRTWATCSRSRSRSSGTGSSAPCARTRLGSLKMPRAFGRSGPDRRRHRPARCGRSAATTPPTMRSGPATAGSTGSG